jgi:hypothetical protein
MLGEILRIDPLTDSEPEMYAFGFRNPFRASSDRTDLGGTREIWTADVGRNHIEEVDGPVVEGGNYGWREKEGTFLFNPNGFELFGFASDGFNSANGRVMYVVEDDRADPEDRTPNVFNLVNGHINLFTLSFGEDMRGEIYVLANKTGGPDEETGVVMKLVRECTGEAACRGD